MHRRYVLRLPQDPRIRDPFDKGADEAWLEKLQTERRLSVFTPFDSLTEWHFWVTKRFSAESVAALKPMLSHSLVGFLPRWPSHEGADIILRGDMPKVV